MRRRLVTSAATVAVILGALCAPVAASAASAVRSSPSPDAVVQATNAMLRPSDVPTSYPRLNDGKPEFHTGYRTSYSGTDPFPVCTSPTLGYGVTVSMSDAIAYEAWFGARDQAADVQQYVYSYGSDDSAKQAWSQLSTAIRSKCNGSHTENGFTSSAKATSSAAINSVPGWAVASSVDYEYTVVNLVGSSIQVVGGYGDMPASKDGRAIAVRNLALTLAERWQNRATLPITQDPIVTLAAETALQPSDVTSATPILQPSRGGDSYFANRANDLSLCGRKIDASNPSQAFTASLGVGEPPATIPGDIEQSMYVYRTPSSAKKAWNQMISVLANCDSDSQSSAAEAKHHQGMSPLSFGGVAGIWSRTWWKPGTSSQSVYDLYLLVGETIQLVSYSRAVSGNASAPIDQSAVNLIAETLANRWAGPVTAS